MVADKWVADALGRCGAAASSNFTQEVSSAHKAKSNQVPQAANATLLHCLCASCYTLHSLSCSRSAHMSLP